MAIVRKAAIPSITGQSPELQSILSPIKESIETIIGARSGVEPIKKLQTPAADTGTAIVGVNDIVNKINELVVRLNVTGTADNDLTVIGQSADPYVQVTGDTMTGALAGTSATFSGDVTANMFIPGSSLMFRNRVLNGEHRVNQRGVASVTVNATAHFWAADRWSGVGTGASGVFTLAQTSTATPPAGVPNYLRATVTTADAALATLDIYKIQHAIEANLLADFAWGTASARAAMVSFQVRSSLTGTFGGVLVYNSAGTQYSYAFTYTISAANTWETKTISIPGPTTGTFPATLSDPGLYLSFGLGAGSRYTAPSINTWVSSDYFIAPGTVNVLATNGATFDLATVQFERGTVATPFEFRPYPVELLMCQRYFENQGYYILGGVCVSGNVNYSFMNFRVSKRVPPNVIIDSINNGGFPNSYTGLTTYTYGYRVDWTSNVSTNSMYIQYAWAASADI